MSEKHRNLIFSQFLKIYLKIYFEDFIYFTYLYI